MLKPPLTKKEAAKFLKMTTRTLDRYRAQGLIRAVKGKNGGKVLFPEDQLESFLKKHLEKQSGDGRPAAFRTTDLNDLLTLRRVQPAK